MTTRWRGVFPAATTQCKTDQSLDLEATARHLEAFIEAGVTGLILCGSLGDNQALDPDEKRQVLRTGVQTRRGDWDKAFPLYRWFTPLLHLDTHVKFVQYIKLAVQECGLGAEWLQAPRLPLVGEERKRILRAIHDGMARRPKVPRRGG